MPEKLKFRRQFLLSSKELNFPDFWVNTKLARGNTQFNLYSHPDLKMTKIQSEGFDLFLFGYFMDLDNPHLNDIEILEKCSQQKNFNSIVHATLHFNGRFVIIYHDEHDTKLFNDATGFREIYYAKIDGHIVCGSTSSIIGHNFNIQKSSEGQLFDLTQSEIFKKNGNLLVGKQTLFPNVYHMLPNHYLNLFDQKPTRFWPVQETRKLDIKDAIKEMCGILKGTFAAATSRDNLYQGLTSGWDTRLLLAASREYTSKIKFYYNRGFKRDLMEKPAVDFRIANEIAEKYGLDFESVELDRLEIDKDFEEIYYQNNALARPPLLPAFYDIYTRGLEDTITVSGTMGNEILRIMFPLNRNVRSNKEILKLLGYESYTFLEADVADWMEDAREANEVLNYNLIDLFNWEQFFGNWGAISASEQDMVREEIRPFNNRKFLDIYIALSDKYRYRDHPIGHVKMIEEMWKELLDFDMDISLYRLKLVLRGLGMERFADRMYQRIKLLKR